MKLAVAKPSWRITGGFERILERLMSELRERGHELVLMEVDVPSVTRCPFGVSVPNDVWEEEFEYFRYVSALETFWKMELPGDVDAVVSTQPPSFAAEHPRHLSIFNHHLRIYYDLSSYYVAAGFANAERHAFAQDVIRRLDAEHMASVDHFLVPSHHVAERMVEFNGITGVGMFRHGPAWFGKRVPTPPVERKRPMALCVGRLEFTKRTELFVQAMHLVEGIDAVVVGVGGRLPFAQQLDMRLGSGELDARTLTETETWLNRGEPPIDGRGGAGRVWFTGSIGDAELARLFSEATCIVAPALLEDHGLTALEAMAGAKPVVVCEDGGGLPEMVHASGAGLIVAPEPAEIADAVAQLAESPGLAREMSERGPSFASEFTWDRAVADVLCGLEVVMGCA